MRNAKILLISTKKNHSIKQDVISIGISSNWAECEPVAIADYAFYKLQKEIKLHDSQPLWFS